MEGISANLLGQLDLIWKVERIHPSPNFWKMLLINYLSYYSGTWVYLT